jgi:hypothetical protein
LTDEEFEEFLHSAVHELQEKQDELMESEGISTYSRYWFDQGQASLDFKDDSGTTGVRALVVPVGSWSPKSNTWKWAWCNESILPALRERSSSLRALASVTGHAIFETETFEADEPMAWELTAIAVRHLGAKGAYRAPGKNSNLFLAITELVEVSRQGWTS